MSELLERAARSIDEGVYEGPAANDPTDTSSHQIAADTDLRLACQLAEWAGATAPDDVEVHEAWAEVYRRRRQAETSLMAKGIDGTAPQAAEAVVDGG